MAVAPSASLPPALARTLQKATTRVRLLRARRTGADGLLAGSVMSGVALIALRLGLGLLNGDAFPNELLLLPPLAGLIGGGLWGATRRVLPLSVLQHIEQRMDLKERLSTAYALSPAGTANDFVALQIADAEAVAAPARLSVATALPFWPVPRRVWASGTSAFAAYLLWFLPTLPLFQSPAERADHAAVQKEGERLIRIAKAMEKSATEKKLEATHKAVEKLNQLGQEMKKGRLSQQKAMMKAAKLTEELKRAQQALASQEMQGGQKSLPAAGQEMQRALAAAQALSKTGAETEKQNNALNAPKGTDGNGNQSNKTSGSSQQAMQSAQNALAGNNVASLAEQLSRLADQTAKGQPGEGAEREKLAEKLAALGKALEGTKLSKASEPLKQAAEAMRKGDMATASEKLREAARKAAEAAKNSSDAQSLEKMAASLSGQGEAGEAQEGEGPADSGEGEADKDAFGKDGSLKKGHVHTVECLKPSGTCYGLVAGEGKGPSNNGIGSGAGKLGGKKPAVAPRSAYQDTSSAPAENRKLKLKMETANVHDDKFSRLYAPGGAMNDTRIHGKIGDKGKETVSFQRGAPDKVSASVPYYEVYGKYAPAVENALNRDDIPAGYKKQVKDYFESLQSGGKAKK